MSQPVIIFYKSEQCGMCKLVQAMWPNITAALREVNPHVRFVEIQSPDLSGKFDETKFPKIMRSYARWFPIFFLIPGKVWDAAMAALDMTFGEQDGVQVLNGEWSSGAVKGVEPPKYDIRQVPSYANWLRDALQHDLFKKNQSGSLIKPLFPAAAPGNPAPILTAKADKIVQDKSETCGLRLVSRK